MKKGFFSVALLVVVFALFFLYYNVNLKNTFVPDDSLRYLVLKTEESFAEFDIKSAKYIYDFKKTQIQNHDIEKNCKFDPQDAFEDLIEDLEKSETKFCSFENVSTDYKYIDENNLDINFYTTIFCSYKGITYSKDFTFKKHAHISYDSENSCCKITVKDLDNNPSYKQYENCIS